MYSGLIFGSANGIVENKKYPFQCNQCCAFHFLKKKSEKFPDYISVSLTLEDMTELGDQE